MILQLNELRDKLAGCWTGKNVGGVLGAPFECKRMIPNVDFYVQDLTQGPPANDDLDLQIVWLAAVERYGRNVNASILGEYWLSFAPVRMIAFAFALLAFNSVCGIYSTGSSAGRSAFAFS